MKMAVPNHVCGGTVFFAMFFTNTSLIWTSSTKKAVSSPNDGFIRTVEREELSWSPKEGLIRTKERVV